MAVLAAIAVATCGGCSYRLGQTQTAALKAEPVAEPLEITGSITQDSITQVSQAVSSPDEGPTDSDMAFARNAASDVLTRGAKDSSQPWENPKTGARGSVTPLASSYTAEGRTCRDFLASYVKGRSEAWLQGEACKAGGRWEIRAMQPWKRS